MNTTRTVLSLLDSVRDHLASFDLPEPINVDVDRMPLTGWEHVTAHLGAPHLPDLAKALLAWADTLTDVHVTAWRPQASDSVHLTVHGRLTDGTTLRAYSGVSHDRNGFDLKPDEKRPILLGALREWAAPNDAGVAA